MSDFTDRKRARPEQMSGTLGEHKEHMETVEGQPWRKERALSTSIKLCRIYRSKGQGKFTRISDKTLIAWERKAEGLQRDIYEYRKHLHNAIQLTKQGYELEDGRWVPPAKREGWASALMRHHRKLMPF